MQPTGSDEPSGQKTSIPNRQRAPAMKAQGSISRIVNQCFEQHVLYRMPGTFFREDGVHHEDHGYSRHATQFTSDRAMVQALKAVEGSAEYSNSLKEAEEHNAAHPEAPQYQIEVRIPLEDALGPHYENHVRGRSRLGSAKKTTGWEATDLKNGTVFALYRYDESTKTYRLYTMYPDK